MRVVRIFCVLIFGAPFANGKRVQTVTESNAKIVTENSKAIDNATKVTSDAINIVSRGVDEPMLSAPEGQPPGCPRITRPAGAPSQKLFTFWKSSGAPAGLNSSDDEEGGTWSMLRSLKNSGDTMASACIHRMRYMNSDFEVVDFKGFPSALAWIRSNSQRHEEFQADLEELTTAISLRKGQDQAKLGVAALTDLLRLFLLKHYGGAWIDGTVILFQPLSSWLSPRSDFVAYGIEDMSEGRGMPVPGQSLGFESWFMFARRPNLVIVADLFRFTVELMKGVYTAPSRNLKDASENADWLVQKAIERLPSAFSKNWGANCADWLGKARHVNHYLMIYLASNYAMCESLQAPFVTPSRADLLNLLTKGVHIRMENALAPVQKKIGAVTMDWFGPDSTMRKFTGQARAFLRTSMYREVFACLDWQEENL